jgi:hypothetical protein
MKSIFIFTKEGMMISGEFAFYMSSVHGIPPEYLDEIATKWLQDEKNFKWFLTQLNHKGGYTNG